MEEDDVLDKEVFVGLFATFLVLGLVLNLVLIVLVLWPLNRHTAIWPFNKLLQCCPFNQHPVVTVQSPKHVLLVALAVSQLLTLFLHHLPVLHYYHSREDALPPPASCSSVVTTELASYLFPTLTRLLVASLLLAHLKVTSCCGDVEGMMTSLAMLAGSVVYSLVVVVPVFFFLYLASASEPCFSGEIILRYTTDPTDGKAMAVVSYVIPVVIVTASLVAYVLGYFFCSAGTKGSTFAGGSKNGLKNRNDSTKNGLPYSYNSSTDGRSAYNDSRTSFSDSADSRSSDKPSTFAFDTAAVALCVILLELLFCIRQFAYWNQGKESDQPFTRKEWVKLWAVDRFLSLVSLTGVPLCYFFDPYIRQVFSPCFNFLSLGSSASDTKENSFSRPLPFHSIRPSEEATESKSIGSSGISIVSNGGLVFTPNHAFAPDSEETEHIYQNILHPDWNRTSKSKQDYTDEEAERNQQNNSGGIGISPLSGSKMLSEQGNRDTHQTRLGFDQNGIVLRSSTNKGDDKAKTWDWDEDEWDDYADDEDDYDARLSKPRTRETYNNWNSNRPNSDDLLQSPAEKNPRSPASHKTQSPNLPPPLPPPYSRVSHALLPLNKSPNDGAASPPYKALQKSPTYFNPASPSNAKQRSPNHFSPASTNSASQRSPINANQLSPIYYEPASPVYFNQTSPNKVSPQSPLYFNPDSPSNVNQRSPASYNQTSPNNGNQTSPAHFVQTSPPQYPHHRPPSHIHQRSPRDHTTAAGTFPNSDVRNRSVRGGGNQTSPQRYGSRENSSSRYSESGPNVHRQGLSDRNSRSHIVSPSNMPRNEDNGPDVMGNPDLGIEGFQDRIRTRESGRNQGNNQYASGRSHSRDCTDRAELLGAEDIREGVYNTQNRIPVEDLAQQNPRGGQVFFVPRRGPQGVIPSDAGNDPGRSRPTIYNKNSTLPYAQSNRFANVEYNLPYGEKSPPGISSTLQGSSPSRSQTQSNKSTPPSSGYAQSQRQHAGDSRRSMNTQHVNTYSSATSDVPANPAYNEQDWGEELSPAEDHRWLGQSTYSEHNSGRNTSPSRRPNAGRTGSPDRKWQKEGVDRPIQNPNRENGLPKEADHRDAYARPFKPNYNSQSGMQGEMIQDVRGQLRPTRAPARESRPSYSQQGTPRSNQYGYRDVDPSQYGNGTGTNPFGNGMEPSQYGMALDQYGNAPRTNQHGDYSRNQRQPDIDTHPHGYGNTYDGPKPLGQSGYGNRPRMGPNEYEHNINPARATNNSRRASQNEPFQMGHNELGERETGQAVFDEREMDLGGEVVLGDWATDGVHSEDLHSRNPPLIAEWQRRNRNSQYSGYLPESEC